MSQPNQAGAADVPRHNLNNIVALMLMTPSLLREELKSK